MKALTQTRLKELLHYEPETGVFTWRVSCGRAKCGDVAGSQTARGYVQITINGDHYRARRLAWLYMTGEFPIGTINPKWSELRDVMRQVKLRNLRKAKPPNPTGILGVCFTKNRFQAQIVHERKCIYLGRFKTKEAAYSAYIKAKCDLHNGGTL